jgi:phospholipid/cholesterol/gamma-HCH transport system substrate-binding protein
MDKKRLEMKVGLFVAVGLILLAILVIQFSKGTSLFRGTYELRLHASNVGGLKEKSGVLLSGVQVGSVDKIKLAPDGKSVTIQLKVYKDFPIYHDARFVIEQAGFLGDQFVSVIPTENKDRLLIDGDQVECQEPFDLQEVARSAAGFIKRLDGTAKQLDAAVTDLRAQVLNAQTLAGFGASITNLRVFTEQALGTIKNINDVIATNGTQIGVAVSNAVYFSAELTRLASSAQDVLATNGANLSAATKNLEDISVTAKQLAADLQAGKGLAGTVLQNPELATNFQDLAANLAITSSNLNRRGLWGILWSHKPAETGTNKNTSAK